MTLLFTGTVVGGIVRALVACAALLCGSIGVPAAGAAPSCPALLTDPAGDTNWLGAGDATRSVEDGRVVDLRSADLQSDRTLLHVTIRVTGNNSDNPTKHLGHSWTLDFSSATASFAVVANRYRVGADDFRLLHRAGSARAGEGGTGAYRSARVEAQVHGGIDEVAGVIRMQVPVAAFAAYGGLGRTLTNIGAKSWSQIGAGGLPHPDANHQYGGTSDFGASQKSYRVGARGCV